MDKQISFVVYWLCWAASAGKLPNFAFMHKSVFGIDSFGIHRYHICKSVFRQSQETAMQKNPSAAGQKQITEEISCTPNILNLQVLIKKRCQL